MTTQIKRALDRTWRTFLQVFLGYLTVATGVGGVHWTAAASAAGLAAVVALLQGLADLPTTPGNAVTDILGRMLRTVTQTALGSIGTATLITDLPWQAMLSASAMAAILSLGTSILTLGVGPKGTPELVAA